MIEVRKVPLAEIENLRKLFLQEAVFQFIHHKCHGAGWADTYLITVEREIAGYGSVWGNEVRENRDTIFEFYLLPPYRKMASQIFSKFRQYCRAPYMECQTNDRLLSHMMFETARQIKAEAILFEVGILTQWSMADTLLSRNASPRDGDPEYVLEHKGQLVASGGFVKNYNFPFIDLYYEVKEDCRNRGFGSLIAQELIREAYRLERIPAARCNIHNLPSKATLLKAGMKVCGHLLLGELDSGAKEA